MFGYSRPHIPISRVAGITRIAGVARVAGIARVSRVPGIPRRPPGIPVGISPPSTPIGAVEIIGSTVPERSPPEIETDPGRRPVIGGIRGGIIIVINTFIIDNFISRGDHDSRLCIPSINGHTASDEGNQRKQYQQFFHFLTPYLSYIDSYCKIHAIVFPLNNSFCVACFCPQIIPPVLNLYNFRYRDGLAFPCRLNCHLFRI